MPKFTVCYEMTGGITIEAKDADEARVIFNEMESAELYENASYEGITEVFEESEEE